MSNSAAIPAGKNRSTYSPPTASFLGYKYIPADRQILHSFLTNKLVIGACIILLALVMVAIFAPWVAPVDPTEQDP